MRRKILGLAAATAVTSGLMFASPASAAHYCKTTPSGVHQTNGNGNRGGNDGWKNSAAGIENAEEAGALEDCTTPPPASNRP